MEKATEAAPTTESSPQTEEAEGTKLGRIKNPKRTVQRKSQMHLE